MERTLKKHTVYRHFKGQHYFVIGAGRHTETGQMEVAYYEMYGKAEMHIRPLHMFLSEVEEGKKNPTGQVYRFEEQYG